MGVFSNLARALAVAGVIGALAYWLYSWMGVLGLLLCAPLAGKALASHLIQLASDAHGFVRFLVLRPRARFYAFRGIPVDVHRRVGEPTWVNVDDVRRILPRLPTAAVLARVHGARLKRIGMPAATCVQVDDLMAWLAPATDAHTTAFRDWLDRTVITSLDRIPSAQMPRARR
ncbi:hypothetical protein [Ideonella margarita]|uniref:Uncharacterized protein n=1 Tax=Ideonella margarita TaxID=2984191 RepID=A0ABU9C984_9BURK